MRSTNILSSALVDATQRFMVTLMEKLSLIWPKCEVLRVASTIEPCRQTWKSDEQKNQSRKSAEMNQESCGAAQAHPQTRCSTRISSHQRRTFWRIEEDRLSVSQSCQSQVKRVHVITTRDKEYLDRKICGDMGNSIQMRKSSFHKPGFPSSISEAY